MTSSFEMNNTLNNYNLFDRRYNKGDAIVKDCHMILFRSIDYFLVSRHIGKYENYLKILKHMKTMFFQLPINEVKLQINNKHYYLYTNFGESKESELLLLLHRGKDYSSFLVRIYSIVIIIENSDQNLYQLNEELSQFFDSNMTDYPEITKCKLWDVVPSSKHNNRNGRMYFKRMEKYLQKQIFDLQIFSQDIVDGETLLNVDLLPHDGHKSFREYIVTEELGEIYKMPHRTD
ncbi:hypothetical protein SNEBB_011157 [Seison nebaliae]|nr:hypothetical protein SNEBB_011157 [Seison nebaliae]